MTTRLALVLLLLVSSALPGAQSSDESWLSWSPEIARERGRLRVAGRVGGFWGIRGLHTERAMNYELRVTWLTPDAMRASSRLRQLRDRSAAAEAGKWLADAEALADTVMMIELDPREGSGVIPLDWAAYLQPRGVEPGDGRSVKGALIEKGRDFPALAGVEKRDYDFDVFWVGFPLRTADGGFLFDGASEAEVVVRVASSEGRVRFAVPPSIRAMSAVGR